MTTNPPESAPSPEQAPGDPVSPGEPAPRQPTGELPTQQPSAQPTEQPTEPVPSTAGFGAAPPPTLGPGGGVPYDQYDQPPRQPTSRLQRSSSDRVITGVCGGLGRHTGVDPILFRIGFVALVFAAGTGVLLYLALAVLMPRDDGQQIWSRAGARTGNGAGSNGAVGVSDPSAYGPPPVPKGPRSPVPGVTVAVLLIGLGIVALGSRYGGWSLDPSTYFALAVATIGVALLVTSFGPWRRSKGGLIALGLLLSFGLFVTSAVDSRGGFDEASFGERSYRPATADQIRDTYQVMMGQSTLDLSGLEFSADDPTEIQINVTMGNFEILVPRDTDVRLNGDALFGSVSAFGDRDMIDGYYGGFGEGPDQSGGGGQAGGQDEPELILDVDVRFGNAEVTRVG